VKLIAWAGGTAAISAILTYAVRGRSSNLLSPSIWKGPADRPAVALTFDDGPSESTPLLLDILARHEARATFFLCGRNVRRLPEIGRQIQRAGHEIGNHGENHPYYCFKSAEFIRDDVSRAQEAIVEAIGVSPKLFRPPYGVRWFGLRGAQRRLGLMGVQWTTIGQDWKKGPEAIVKLVLKNTRNGGIVCLHDGRTTSVNPEIRSTLEAVSTLVPLLKAKGLDLVTVSELTRPRVASGTISSLTMPGH
jgi:peptidoglycan/xylan/chitin deacetylase (PgdA/CDA1 family)